MPPDTDFDPDGLFNWNGFVKVAINEPSSESTSPRDPFRSDRKDHLY